jgi:hypothetical protein
MNHKLMPRLGSAIASTVLSVFWAVSLVGVDKAQAALLTFNFETEWGEASGFFKVDNSSVTGTGIEVEEIAVSEGRLYTWLTSGYNRYKKQPKEFFDLAGATAYFDQGNFRGLRASGFDELTPEDNIIVDEGVTYYTDNNGAILWSLDTYAPDDDDAWTTFFAGHYSVILGFCCDDTMIVDGTPVSYTLVNTEPSPVVPEPLTAGGTALALAGLSWLKHKKKMAA